MKSENLEKYIEDLKISSSVKLSLKDIGITKVSELKGYNYKTLAAIFFTANNVKASIYKKFT